MTIPYNFISVEGIIGVGKTTLATKLARYYNAELILEPVEENPFLSQFYDNIEAFAFQTQIFFLFARYKQMQKLMQNRLFFDLVISDYIFEKDQIFANINLDENELILYEHIIKFIKKDVPKPDLIIYLQASTETIMKRIKHRGRTFEENISVETTHGYSWPLLISNSILKGTMFLWLVSASPSNLNRFSGRYNEPPSAMDFHLLPPGEPDPLPY